MSTSSLRQMLTPAQSAVYDAIRAQSEAHPAPVYLVGGAVRDWLLRSSGIDDLDFAIDGDAIAFGRALQARHGGALAEHEQFNTTRWLWQGESVDIAMTRRERYTRPAALPEVSAAPIEVDLHRRDFTVNAMALRLTDDVLLDPHGGADDLAQRRLRALHDASFVDDPTRLLRGARYAARLNFDVEPRTQAAIGAGVQHLRELSGERIKYDVELIFQDRDPAAALALLRDWQVFAAFGIPAPGDAQLRDRFDRVRAAFDANAFPVARLERDTAGLLAAAGWGALTYNQGQLPARRWIDRVPFEADLRDALIDSGPLSTASAAMFHGKPSALSALLREFGGLVLWLGWLFDNDAAKRAALLSEWREWRWVRPQTTGDDLKALGVPPGPRYKQLLERLRDARLDGEADSLAAERALVQRLLSA